MQYEAQAIKFLEELFALEGLRWEPSEPNGRAHIDELDGLLYRAYREGFDEAAERWDIREDC